MKKEYQFVVYMMASLSGVLYIGVTNHIYGRVREHKENINQGFTQRNFNTLIKPFQEKNSLKNGEERKKKH